MLEPAILEVILSSRVQNVLWDFYVEGGKSAPERNEGKILSLGRGLAT